jgi:glyoxylase-like metal-dependent hydrolase (beta-lactamase superfamily II)
MPSLKVLVEGYAKEIEHGWEANSTTTLIQNEGKYIIVDPGLDESVLEKALEGEGLEKGDIDCVFLTHYHLDHILNARLFRRAIIADGHCFYKRNRGKEHDGKLFGENIEIMHTPGHTPEHSSLIFSTTEATYAVAGDLIWWHLENGRAALNLPDPFACDVDALIKSRKNILQKADFIIPGHGRMFKVD